MRLGIFGFPVSGKTTIFNALTGSNLPTGPEGRAGRFEVHTAVVDVPDPRLDALSALMKPKKTTYAKVTYVDTGGYSMDGSHEGLPGELVNQLETMDGLVHVVRAFENPLLPHTAGEVDAARDVASMEAELILHDMLTVERRLERLAEDRMKGGRERVSIDREMALFQKLESVLNSQKPLRDLDFSTEEHPLLTGYGLLSDKPMLILINLAEGQPSVEIETPAGRTVAIPIYGELEMEIAQLPPEDAQTFLDEYGIQESGRQRVIKSSYDLLGLQSFFTVNEREARAWTILRSGTALEAAETIHSDMARGFIRAEVIQTQTLLDLGGLAQARAGGKLRLEGKDYPVQDGDVIYIRFNV